MQVVFAAGECLAIPQYGKQEGLPGTHELKFAGLSHG